MANTLLQWEQVKTQEALNRDIREAKSFKVKITSFKFLIHTGLMKIMIKGKLA